ncbi:MAG: hypothetical protein OXU30_12545, partial [Gammaproteobacteria bacterium]|nr:hypothetical protein [Gammaproteobacteria bacterium]
YYYVYLVHGSMSIPVIYSRTGKTIYLFIPDNPNNYELFCASEHMNQDFTQFLVGITLKSLLRMTKTGQSQP